MQKQLEGILRGTWNETSTDSPHQPTEPRRWADDVFRIAVLNCWPRYFIPKKAHADRIVALYDRYRRCDEPETLSEEEVRVRVKFFIDLGSNANRGRTVEARRKRENLKTVASVVEMHRQVCTAARKGHLLMRPDGYGGFGFFRPPAGAGICKEIDSGVTVAGIQGLLGQVAKISKKIAEGFHGAKSSIVCCHRANKSTVYRPLIGPLSYFNGACVHCAQARPMNLDATGDGWDTAQWTRPEVHDEAGQQVFIWYGPTYDGGGSTLQAVSPYLPEFILMPVGTDEDVHSTGKCPRCAEYAGEGFRDLRDRWAEYVKGDLLEWHEWLAGESTLAQAVRTVTKGFNKDITVAHARKAISKCRLTMQHIPEGTGTLYQRLLEKARAARPMRDIAKRLIYGTRSSNIAAVCEKTGNPRYHDTMLTPDELQALREAAGSLRTVQDKVLILRRLHPHFKL